MASPRAAGISVAELRVGFRGKDLAALELVDAFGQRSVLLFSAVQQGRLQLPFLHQETTTATRRIVTLVVWGLGAAVAYPYLPGSGSAAFQGVSVLVGLMLSLGASSIVSQGASGLILTYSRTFKPGEYVRIGDHEGTITDLGIFNTRMRTGWARPLNRLALTS